MDKAHKYKYHCKAKDSFKTKKNLFLFQVVLNRRLEFTKDDFDKFKVEENLVKLYTTEYWQKMPDERIDGIEISEIYKRLQALEKSSSEILMELEYLYVQSFSKIMTEKDFEKLLSNESCHYCGITKEIIEKLCDKQKLFKKNLRGWNLEVDRINSNYEYELKNCVLACYWCNNAKTDEFTDEEFQLIGEAIKQVWERRLND